MLKVIEASYVEGYTVSLTFSNGKKGNVDLKDLLWGEVFEPLRDPSIFRKFTVSPIFDTLCWENGADISPEYLYDKICGIVSTNKSNDSRVNH